MTIGANGGVIGPVANATYGLGASGIWRPSRIAQLMTLGVWPPDITGDSYWPQVTGLFQFEGTNGDTNSANIGSVGTQTPNWWTAASTLTNTEKPFGVTSFPCTASHGLYFDGHTGWIVGTGDFTWEGWFYPTSDSGGNRTLFGWRPANGVSGGVTDFIEVQHHSSYRIGMQLFGNNHQETTDSSNNALVVNTWQHVALSRVAGTTRLYVGGTQVCTHADANNYGATSGTNARMAIGCGGYDSSQAFVGYLKDIRITKGVGRYSSAFTPVQVAFPNH